MTTIAWDGKTLAADKMGDAGGMRITVTKIRRAKDGSLLGGAGTAAFCLEMFDWIEAGAAPDKLPKNQETDDWSCIIRIMPSGKILRYDKCAVPLVLEDGRTAIGSGRDYAVAAMHLGCDAITAVRVAAVFDPGTGSTMDTLTLEPTHADA